MGDWKGAPTGSVWIPVGCSRLHLQASCGVQAPLAALFTVLFFFFVLFCRRWMISLCSGSAAVLLQRCSSRAAGLRFGICSVSCSSAWLRTAQVQLKLQHLHARAAAFIRTIICLLRHFHIYVNSFALCFYGLESA